MYSCCVFPLNCIQAIFFFLRLMHAMDSKFLCCFVHRMFLCIPYNNFFFKFDCILFIFHAKVRISPDQTKPFDTAEVLKTFEI